MQRAREDAAVEVNQAVAVAAARGAAGDPVAAAEILSGAIAAAPRNAALWAFRGRMWRLAGHVDRAAEDLSRAIALDPTDPYPAAQQSWILWVRGERAAAKRRLRRVARRHPGYHWAFTYLAQQHLVTRQLHAAERAIACALAIAPRCAYSLRIQADLLANRGRYRRALAMFDEVLASAPGDAYAHAERGLVLGHLGRHAEGVAALDRAISQLPRLRHFWRDRAALHILRGDASSGLRDCLAAIEVSAEPEPLIAYRVAQLHRQLGDVAASRRAYGHVRRLLPGAGRRHLADRLGSLTRPRWTPGTLLGPVGIMDQPGAPLR